jgi:hypothetical protein
MNKIGYYSDTVATANTAKDGTGAVAFLIKADTQDLYVDRVIFMAIGSNVATVARIFINNGRDHAVASNNTPFMEETLAATTLDEAAAFAVESVATDLWLPKGYRLMFTLGTTVAAGVRGLALGGSYQDLQSKQ